jgi:excisionase family DNA binding protein
LKLIKPRKACELLAVGLSTLYAWAASGAIPSVTLHRGKKKKTIRFDEADLTDFVQKQSMLHAAAEASAAKPPAAKGGGGHEKLRG